MSVFCHACGTANEDDASFCDNCGEPLRKRAVPAPAASAPQVPASPAGASPSPRVPAAAPRFGRGLVAGLGAGALVVVVAAAGLFWWLQPPAASAGALSAALEQSSPGLDTSERMVCIANGLDYSSGPMNIRAMHRPSVDWMEALVQAGLYTNDGTLSSGGFFPQTLIRYSPTDELQKWVRGNRLCLGSGLSLVTVTDIGEPQVRQRGDQEHRLVTASAVWGIKDPAPWLGKESVRQAMVGELPQSARGQWRVDGESLVFRNPSLFVVEDRAWKTVDPSSARAYQTPLQQRESREAERAESSSGGLFSWLSGLFGGNPLVGEWEVDTGAMGLGNLPRAFGSGNVIKVTSNSIDMGQGPMKADFEVKGNEVLVTMSAAGSEQVRFGMRGDDAAFLDLGLMQIPLKRIK